MCSHACFIQHMHTAHIHTIIHFNIATLYIITSAKKTNKISPAADNK